MNSSPWPDSWWVEEKCSPPDAYWAAQTAKYPGIGWSRGRVAGPPWLRRLVGDTRPPLFKEAAGE